MLTSLVLFKSISESSSKIYDKLISYLFWLNENNEKIRFLWAEDIRTRNIFKLDKTCYQSPLTR
jgi:hypothetical protein